MFAFHPKPTLRSQLQRLREFERIIHLNSEVAHGALQLRMPQ